MTRVFMTTDAVGGVWHYCVALAGELVRGGDRVRLGVVGPAPSARQRDAADLAGAGVQCLDAPLDWLAGGTAGLDAGRAAIAEAARGWQADIVQVDQPAYAAGHWAAPVVTVAHSCVETWWRGTHGVPAPAEWDWHRQAVGQGLRTAAIAIAPSRAFAAALREAYGLDRAPMAVPNGIAPGGRPAAKGAFVLASGRAWDASKNFALLDAAAPAIRWPVRLAGDTVAPDGAGAMTVRHVHCLGALGPQRMAAEYAAAPIYVSPSLCEPFGLGVLEAAQAGAALVLSDIPVFRELWDGAAIFFGRRDAQALARAVNRLIDEPGLRRRVGAAAAARAGEYTVSATARVMRDCYAQALATGAARARPRVPA